MTRTSMEVIGLIPAAGEARRLGALPCSKEIFPVGFTRTDDGGLRPKAACEDLLSQLRRAGVERAYVVLREGKWDVPAYLSDGHRFGLSLAYLMARVPFGTPFTADAAYPFVRDALVAFGFPDILVEPDDAVARLLTRQAATEADVVLGLFPAAHPRRMDMVEVEEAGRVLALHIKPPETALRYTWVLAVWTPAFTAFLHQWLAAHPAGRLEGREPFVGDVIQAALARGMHVDSVLFPGGRCLDVGTPEELAQAVREQAARVS